MKILKCKICLGEVDLIEGDRSINRKVKCRKCNFTNDHEIKGPEVLVIRKRPPVKDQ